MGLVGVGFGAVWVLGLGVKLQGFTVWGSRAQGLRIKLRVPGSKFRVFSAAFVATPLKAHKPPEGGCRFCC